MDELPDELKDIESSPAITFLDTLLKTNKINEKT